MNINVVSSSNYHDFAYSGKVMQSTGAQEQRNYVGKSNNIADVEVALIGTGRGGEEIRDISSDLGRIADAIEYINDKLEFTQTKFEYTYHDDIRRVSVKILDKSTDDVIREIPPEKTINLIRKLWEFAGLIVDERR